MTQRNFHRLLPLIDQKDRQELTRMWHLISSVYKDAATRSQFLVDWLFNNYFKIENPLTAKGLTHREIQYVLENFLYVSKELALGFEPQWMITYRYINPDDKVRPNDLNDYYNKRVRSSEEVTYSRNHDGSSTYKYKETEPRLSALKISNQHYLKTQPIGDVKLIQISLNQYLKQTRERKGFSCVEETNYDKWMRRRYADIDEIVADTRKVNKRILRNLFGVRNLNNYGNALPNLYYFHEKGKGKNRHDCPHHTHLLLPRMKHHGKRELEHYFNSDKRFRSLKCLSHQSIKVSKIYDAKGIFNYLCKENSLNHISLDERNSTPIQRRTNDN